MTSLLDFLGCDRSDYFLDFVLLDEAKNESRFRVAAKAEAVEPWLANWRREHPQHRLAVCFEQPAANLIALFSRFDFVILYPINPATLRSYRETFVTSGAKDDPDDSFWLADLVRTHRDKLTAWLPESAAMRKLQALVQLRRNCAERLTTLSNQIGSLLKSYFPEALELIGEDKTSVLACDFLRRWPSLPHLQRSRWSSIESFYRSHHCVLQSALQRRRETIAHALPLTTDPAILEPAQMQLTLLLDLIACARRALARFDDSIQETFDSHPDHLVFASLPGAGRVFAPRLLAAIGEQRGRFDDPSQLQCASGIAPVMIRSGQSCWIKRRHACPKFTRQSFHEWAAETIRHSRWARAFYDQQKQHGKKHHTIARSLAFKWQRILFRCWKSRCPYNEATYMSSLQQHNPQLYQLALSTKLPREILN